MGPVLLGRGVRRGQPAAALDGRQVERCALHRAEGDLGGGVVAVGIDGRRFYLAAGAKANSGRGPGAGVDATRPRAGRAAGGPG